MHTFVQYVHTKVLVDLGVHGEKQQGQASQETGISLQVSPPTHD